LKAGHIKSIMIRVKSTKIDAKRPKMTKIDGLYVKKEPIDAGKDS